MILRQPSVAGRFYPKDSDDLNSVLGPLIRGPREEKDIIGCVVPHGMYAYCGKTQARAYMALGNGDFTFVILGTNHHRTGPKASIMTSGKWRTPLGDYPINNDIAAEIKSESGIGEDIESHSTEHSIEVQLPWLQKLFPRSSFVPISIGNLSLDEMASLGKSISRVSVGRRIVVMASSDFTHYGEVYNHVPVKGDIDEILEYVEGIDRQAAQRITALDPRGFVDFVETHNMNICGYATIATMLFSVEEWAYRASILDYSTSYPVSKSKDSIVGYCSIAVE
ncbi:MAG: AmmeMemoRadiSam system protein B [Candidatus Aenigmarchaeota archaeon]|nr:AmmeMemoRadiSam system protein B [Candidatus Aenigmarchaeota archaeon]